MLKVTDRLQPEKDARMLCEACYGTTIALVPVPSTRGLAWVKIGCDACDGGYTRTPIDWTVAALATPASAE